MKMITPLKFGFIAGMAAIIFQVLIYLVAPEKVSTSIWMFVIYLPVLLFMIFGGITYRKELDGKVTFGKMFLSVFTIALLGVVLVNCFTYEILMSIIDPDLFRTIVEHARRVIIDSGEKKGLSDEMVEQSMKGLDMLTLAMLRKIAWGVSGFFTFLLSLLVTLFVNRPEKTSINPGA